MLVFRVETEKRGREKGAGVVVIIIIKVARRAREVNYPCSFTFVLIVKKAGLILAHSSGTTRCGPKDPRPLIGDA